MEKLNELDQLVKQYKKKKDKKILDQIFKILYPTIVEKAKYVFFEQSFKYQGIEFRLVDTKQVELDDVIQQLSLEIIEWINDFKPKAPFSHYLNSRFEQQHWQPKFMDIEFYKRFKTQSVYKTIENEEGEEEVNIADNIPTPEEVKIEFFPELIEIEQEVWDLMQGNLNLSQEEIAEELDISQKTVSNVIASIRKKVQK
jgi:RNA polymerase sigma factor (sigma-70 family)